jgi:hypothetical protein
VAAPTLESDVQTVFNTTTSPKSVSVTAASGRRLVAGAANSEYGTGTYDLQTPSGPSWLLRQDQGVGSCSLLRLWTAASAGSYTHQQAMTNPGSPYFGAIVWVYSGSDGHDSSNGNFDSTDAVANLALVTTTANCAVVYMGADYNANADTSRDWLTINGGAATEDLYFNDGSFYTVYAAHWDDAGAAGSKTVGLNTYAASMYLSQATVGTKGSTAADYVRPTIVAPSAAVHRASRW